MDDRDILMHPLLKHPMDKKRTHSNCVNRRNKARKKTDYEYYLKVLYNNVKTRAKKNGTEFDIEFSDLKLNKICPLLNIELQYGGGNDNSPSFDRIDNTRGYVKGNVRIISNRANRWKNDMSYDNIKMMFENYYEL